MSCNLFVKQEPVKDEFLLSLTAGRVVNDSCGDGFHIDGWQNGAMETFSVGQPVYDKDNNLMGYLNIGLYNNLNYYSEKENFHGEKIPSEYWGIGKPTEHCEVGKQVFTYWQRWRAEKEKQ
jgi:hypothetical protein